MFLFYSINANSFLLFYTSSSWRWHLFTFIFYLITARMYQFFIYSWQCYLFLTLYLIAARISQFFFCSWQCYLFLMVYYLITARISQFFMYSWQCYLFFMLYLITATEFVNPFYVPYILDGAIYLYILFWLLFYCKQELLNLVHIVVIYFLLFLHEFLKSSYPRFRHLFFGFYFITTRIL